MSHEHDIKKTRVVFVEFDDIVLNKLAKDMKYFGEENSKGRTLVYDFEYCLNCSLRLLNGKSIMTKDILEEEFERIVIKARNNNYLSSEQTTLQHTDFELLERIIKSALELGKLKETRT